MRADPARNIRAKITLRAWHKNVYARRSRMLAEGNGKIEWIDPGTRVSWSEIEAKARELGIADNVVDLRLWWHRA